MIYLISIWIYVTILLLFFCSQLVVGDYGLSYYQQKAQFGMWAMLASPMFMSVDLHNIKAEAKAILLNKEVIAINQDPLGAQALMLYGVRV